MACNKIPSVYLFENGEREAEEKKNTHENKKKSCVPIRSGIIDSNAIMIILCVSVAVAVAVVVVVV